MDSDKQQKMEANGYQYDEDLLCFVNREAGKIFSTAWLEDQNMNTIQISLNIPHNPAMWKLFLSPDQRCLRSTAKIHRKREQIKPVPFLFWRSAVSCQPLDI